MWNLNMGLRSSISEESGLELEIPMSDEEEEYREEETEE